MWTYETKSQPTYPQRIGIKDGVAGVDISRVIAYEYSKMNGLRIWFDTGTDIMIQGVHAGLLAQAFALYFAPEDTESGEEDATYA